LRASVQALRGAFYWVRESAPLSFCSPRKQNEIMKIQSFLAIFMTIFTLKARAQTNIAPIIITNIWTVMPWYREVDGKVYDPKFSALWKPINGLAEIKEIMPNVVIWQYCEEQKMFNNSGLVMAENRIYGKKFAIRHESLEVVTAGPDGLEVMGKQKIGSLTNFKDFIAMYVGTTNYNGETMPVWDCGEPVKGQTVTVISTNYPKAFNQNKQKRIDAEK